MQDGHAEAVGQPDKVAFVDGGASKCSRLIVYSARCFLAMH